MTKKEIFKNDILMAMKYHLKADQMAILENVLSEALYKVELVEVKTLPATIDMTNEYIMSLYELKKGSRLSPETMRAYMVTFKEFIRFIDKSLLQVTQEDVEYYLRTKFKAGNSNTSLNNKRRKLNSLFEWIRKQGLIIRNPVEGTEKFTEVVKPIDHMEAEEMEQLKAGCRTKRDRALIEWLRCTAMRKGEIPEVTINQIDWQKGRVMIFGSKGKAYRIVCLDSVAMKYLKEYISERGLDLRSNQPLFTHCRGDVTKALSKSGVYSEVKRIAAASGLDRRVYPHLFRKTTATNILRRGGTDSDAGEYLGHKPQGVTARHYAFRSEDHTVKIFESYVAVV